MTNPAMVQEHFVEVDGIRTRYLSSGAGKPIVLLHAVGMCAETFYTNLCGLSDRYRVIAVDLPGHGYSHPLEIDDAAPQALFAAHVIALMDRLEIDQFALAGSSFGALVAALAYFLQPERVKALGLVGSGSVFHTAETQKMGFVGTRANGTRAMRNPTVEGCFERLKNIVFDPYCIPYSVARAQSEIYTLPDRLGAYEAVIDGTVATIDQPDARVLERLESIRCATAVIVGRNDIRADWQCHVDGAGRIADSRVHVYDRCGHLPYLEHPDQFNRHFAQLLADAGYC